MPIAKLHRAQRCEPTNIRIARACRTVLVAAAALAWTGVASADGASPLDASPQDKKRAQARYEEGAKLFEARRFAEALKAFQESYRIVASPNSHLMIARAERELGQYAAAYEDLERAEQEARELSTAEPAKYGPTVEKAAADREALRPRIALVTVRVRGGELADLSVGGRPIARDRWSRPIAASPGVIEVAATGRDGRRVSRSVTVGAGATGDVDIDLAPHTAAVTPPPVAPTMPSAPPNAGDDATPSKRSSLLPWVFVAGGVGVAGMGLFTAFGLMNNSTHDEFQSDLDALKKSGVCRDTGGKLLCDDTAEARAVQEKGSDGSTQQTIANVGLIVGGVGLATAAALLVVDLTRSSKSDEVSAGLAPTVAVGWRTVAVTGRF